MANVSLIRSLDAAYDSFVISALKAKGYTVNEFAFADSQAAFAANDPVIICGAYDCAAKTATYANDFLNRGGNLITLGGPAFVNEHYAEADGKTTAELAQLFAGGAFGKRIGMDFTKTAEEYGFEPDTANPDSKKVEITATVKTVEDEKFGRALEWYSDRFAINEAFEAPFTFNEDENVIGFYARADENTRTITVKVLTNEGDTFKARITPEKDYQFFMLSARDFVYDGNRFMTLSWRRYGIQLDLSKVIKLQFGHALSHAYSVAGEHTFRIAEVSACSIPFINNDKIVVDGLCPKFKFFPVKNVSAVKVSDRQAILAKKELPLYEGMFSHPPRQQGLGFDNDRHRRFIPLIETIGKDGLNSGFLAYMMLNRSTRDFSLDFGGKDYKRNGSALAAFTVNDPKFYEDGGADMVADALSAMLRPVMLVEGGTDEFIYRNDMAEGKAGILCSAKIGADLTPYTAKLSAPGIDLTVALSDFAAVKEDNGLTYLRYAVPFAAKEGDARVSLYENGVLVDQLAHTVKIHTLKPEAERRYAKILPGTNEISIDGKPTRFFGVNYMPTYDMSNESFWINEHYVSAFSYDPDVIEVDLQRCKNIGLNAVSLFVYYEPSLRANNILHLMTRCEELGIYVNLSLRPHANPFDFAEHEVRALIEKYRLDKLDNLVGYDIAWERYVGTYEPCYGNMNGRKSFDADWRFFLKNRYGSYEKAEEVLGYPLPRNAEGEVIGLCDDMLREDGDYNKLVAAYRQCIDHSVRRAHHMACDFIRSVDPNHLISARSGDASTIPLVDPGIYGYDYDAMSAAVDTTSPESYALSDDEKSIRQGVFTNIYSRYANPDNVVQWMEFGKSIWTGSNFTPNTKNRGFQAEYYRRFFDMLLTGHTAGMFCWWYFGGYRIGENSDFGIVDPDGGIRPVTEVLMEYSPKFLNAPPLKKPDVLLEIDRDLHADGLRSVYRGVEDELFAAIKEGKTVAFVDKATGTTSADVSLTEVGNIEPTGCSPKYLDGIITSIRVITENGTVTAANGGTVELGADASATLQIMVQNTTYAKWLAGDGYGSVHFTSDEDSAVSFALDLPCEMNKRDRVCFTVFADKAEGTVKAKFTAKERSVFGDRLELTIKRK